MADTNGTLYGQFDGNTLALTFGTSNLNNPNALQANALFQILAPGGACLLQVSSTGTVSTNVATASVTPDAVIAIVQMTAAQFAGLAASPTASQICAAAFPLNFNNQQLDIFQINNFTQLPGSAGGGAVVGRLSYNGVYSTT